MSLVKKSYYFGRKPKIVKDLFRMFIKDSNTGSSVFNYSTYITPELLYRALHYLSMSSFDENANEYEIYIRDFFFKATMYYNYTNMLPIEFWGYGTGEPNVSLLSNYIFKHYGNRPILPTYFDDIVTWDGDYYDMHHIKISVENDIQNAISDNIYKWSNLLKSCMLDFNPLWNVDGTETTTRTLEQDGTIKLTKRGDDITSQKIIGTKTKTGTEKTDITGSDISQLSGNDTDTTSNTTTESTSFYDATKTIHENGKKDTMTYGKSETLTHNVSDGDNTTIDTDIVYNNDDTTTKDLVDTERILLERHGNIGVTTTTKLLTEFREYVKFNLLDVIAKDIVKNISEGVY